MSKLTLNAIMNMTGCQKELNDKGYTVFKHVLDPVILNKATAWCQYLIDTTPKAHWNLFKSQGSRISIADMPEFAELIGHQTIMSVLGNLGFDDITFSSGAIFSRPPSCPPLFWHQDWWGWDDDESYGDRIAQINVMLYLNPTNTENGCLRVMPGTHKHRHAIHDIQVQYDAALCRVEQPENPIYHSWEGEQAICVEPGDIVVTDTRLLHSAYPNQSPDSRVLLSLNYHPGYSNLPESIQARILSLFMGEFELRDGDKRIKDSCVENRQFLASWPEEQRNKISHLFPYYQGNAKPLSINPKPDPSRLNAE